MALNSTFSPEKPSFRGNSSSEDTNKNYEEILYDLNTIFAEATSIVVQLNEIESKLRHEMDSIHSRVYAVSGYIIEQQQQGDGAKMFFDNFFLMDNVVYPENVNIDDRCVVESEFGTVTLPVVQSVSKIYTTNMSNGVAYPYPDIGVSVVPLDEGGNIGVVQNDVNKAFDGSLLTTWERRVKFDRDYSKSSVSCQMEVTLPSMNNPDVNSVFIHPYPEGTVDVTSITYDTASTQDNLLDNFPVLGEYSARSRMYTFNNIQPTSFKVNFRQANAMVEDNANVFVYGLQEFGVERIEYKSSGKMGVKFDLPAWETGTISEITLVKTNPDYDNDSIKLSIYGSEDDFNNNIPAWTSSSFSISGGTNLNMQAYGSYSIWVMIELNQSDGDSRTPSLKDITITYTTI